MNFEVLGESSPVVEQKGLGKKALVFMVATALLGLALVATGFAYPQPKGYVTDDANLMTPDQVNRIEHRLSEYHKQTGIEIAVVTVPNMGGQNVEQYANGLFHTWGIGKKGKDNGLLLLLAMQERKIRIEVGYGLEGQLNDAFCGTVIREKMGPQFKQKQYSQGFRDALEAIFQRLGK